MTVDVSQIWPLPKGMRLSEERQKINIQTLGKGKTFGDVSFHTGKVN
jgi:hypothetical protein